MEKYMEIFFDDLSELGKQKYIDSIGYPEFDVNIFPISVVIVQSDSNEIESSHDPCETCRKLGTIMCGNDTKNHSCYEEVT